MIEEREKPRVRDPRLLPQTSEPLSALAYYGRLAGWAGSTLLLAALFWAGIKHGLVLPVKVIGILGLLCLGFWLYTNLHALVLAIKARGTQAALNSTLFSVFVLGILVLVNYIGARHHILRHDFSKAKQYSLSDATKNVLRDLKEPVTITAFISKDYYNYENLKRLLDEYSYASSKLKVNIYDFKTAVEKVQEYNAAYDGTMFVECGKDDAKKKEEIRGGTEEQITSAILAASTGEKTRICFLSGHGEAQLDGFGEGKRGLSMIKGILENQQYKCDTINLVTQKDPQVPADCKLLVIAGPKYALSPKELTAIQKYVDQGGNLMLMVDPPSAMFFADLLKAHGVTPLGGQVTDRMNSAEGQPEVLVAFPDQHDTTKGLQMLILPTSTAFEVENPEPPPPMPGGPPPPPQKGQALLKTAETATLSGPTTRKGPLTMAVAVDENPPKPQQMPGMPEPPQPEDEGPRKARIIVVGDSDFATDNMINMLGGPQGFGGQNLAFAVMSMNWLVKNEKLVAIPPKERVDNAFSVTDAQRRFASALVLFIVPLLIIFSGTVVWWLRRRS